MDDELVALLEAAPPEAWVQLATAADALAAVDRWVTWQESHRFEDGSWTMPYPEYEPEVFALTAALGGIGAVTPLADWMGWEGAAAYTTAEAVAAAPPADLVRLATAFVRGERFTEGTLDTVTADGRLLALARALLAWRALQLKPSRS